MLTRHLYRIDEVRGCFRYALLWRNIREACFWCLELLDTQLFSEALEDCAWVWLYGIGVTNLGFLEEFQKILDCEDVTAEHVLSLTYSISRCSTRDCSVGWLLDAGLTSVQPDFLVRKGEGESISMAIAQGKSLLAWCLLRPEWESRASSFLRKDIQIPEFITKSFEWEVRALLLLATCWATEIKSVPQAEIQKDIADMIEEWKGLEGKRARRVFRIRSEAIQFGTRRSLEPNTVTNIREIRNPEAALRGSPFWEQVAEDMGGWKTIRRNDDIREAFYDLYFPDDIPDEWSRIDQEKSHGYGLFAQSSTTLNQSNKQLRSYFTGLSVRGLQSLTVVKRATEESYEVLYKRCVTECVEQMAAWDLKPRRKKLCPRVGNAETVA